MSTTTQKRFSAKKLHVLLLRVLLFSGFALLAVTLTLQIANIILPTIESDTLQPLLGRPSNSFHINKETIFPFLLGFLLLEIIAYFYLKRLFAHNNISAMERISYFKKHSRTVFSRKFFTAFSAFAIAVSVVLAILCNAVRAVSEAWFGTIAVIGTCVLLCFSAKLMRHIRRQNLSHKHRAVDKGE